MTFSNAFWQRLKKISNFERPANVQVQTTNGISVRTETRGKRVTIRVNGRIVYDEEVDW